MTFQNPIAGRKFPTKVSLWSRIFKAVRKVETATGDNPGFPEPRISLAIANNTGSTLDAFSWVALGGVVGEDTDDGYAESMTFEAVAINTSTPQQYAVLAEELKPGEAGDAYITGMVTAKTVSTAYKPYGKMTNAGLEFSDTPSQFRIIHKRANSNFCKVFIGSEGGTTIDLVEAVIEGADVPVTQSRFTAKVVKPAIGSTAVDTIITCDNPEFGSPSSGEHLFGLLVGMKVWCIKTKVTDTIGGTETEIWHPMLSGSARVL